MMGVIRKINAFPSASLESLQIPSSGEEDVLSESEEMVPQPTPKPRSRMRMPAVPMSFGTSRKIMGRKRALRRHNQSLLAILLEDEEDGGREIVIQDFSTSLPKYNLFESEAYMEVWNIFVESSEEDQHAMITKSESNVAGRGPEAIRTGEEAFKNIERGLRTSLMHLPVPLNVRRDLEKSLVAFFIKTPKGVYASAPLPRLDRLILHGLAQYYLLVSHGTTRDHNNIGRVTITNPKQSFMPPLDSLETYFERISS